MRHKSIQDIQRDISRGVSDLENASKEAYHKNKERIGKMESDVDSLRSQVDSLCRTVEIMANALESTREQLSEANDKIENLLSWASEAEKWREVFEDWAAQIQKDTDGPGYKPRPSSDAYSDLGLSSGASKEEIKRAYRDLAKKHHPDKGGDAKIFQKIQKAYDDLMEAA